MDTLAKKIMGKNSFYKIFVEVEAFGILKALKIISSQIDIKALIESRYLRSVTTPHVARSGLT